MSEPTPLQVLRQYWGYSSFRPLQEDIIHSVVNGTDTLAILPTGGGKSICYQVPALMQEGVCVVISPLIALMRDQVEHLKSKGIKAVAVMSGMSYHEIDIALDNCVYGDYKLLYMSPERLETELAQVRLQKMNISLLAVDEAHCISQWGYDFRPSYLKIAGIRELLPGVPVLALTGSATPVVRDDMMEKLHFAEQHCIQGSFERKNITYAVRYSENKMAKLLEIFRKVKGTGIVYVRNRRHTREVADALKKQGVSASFYHAGLTHDERARRQDAWQKGQIRVMACTNAFGMGIDKPDVRTVVHLDLPENVESYYQEAGRAGRDGNKSFAVLLFNLSDKFEIERRLETHFPSVEEVRNIYASLCNYLKVAFGAGVGETFAFNLPEFCRNFKLSPVKTHYAVKLLEQQGVLEVTTNAFLPSRVLFKMNKSDLYKFQVENRKYDYMIKQLLRTYPGLFDEYVDINEATVAKKLGMEKNEIVKQLNLLKKMEVLDYEEQTDLPRLTMLIPREDSRELQLDNRFMRQRKEVYEGQLRAMLGYALNKTQCRSQYILNYFGETDNYRCGVCDVCLERNKLDLHDKAFESVEGEIQQLLSERPRTMQELIPFIKSTSEQEALKVLRWMIDSGVVYKDDENRLSWSG